jgi:hypothetical protein
MAGRVALFIIWVAGLAQAAAPMQTVTLNNGTMRMQVNVHGGAVSSCTLNGQDLNPFNWKQHSQPGNPSRKEGLFTCFDRVGKPSAADAARGVPSHGEAAAVRWDVLEKSTSRAGDQLLRMRCKLPVARMTLVREYCLFRDSSVCRITDRITNDNTVVKPYNVLLHPSHAPPFLDDSVIIDCNASRGFINTKDIRTIPGPTIAWPQIRYQDEPVNLRRMKDGNWMVANFVCDEQAVHGWGSVANPGRELLVGCLWPRDDYPWIRVWREWEDDAPKALGVEFGTTPLAIPFEQIRQVGDLLDQPTLQTLEPGAMTEKTFYLFLARIPRDFSGTEAVALDAGTMKIQERSAEKKREIILPCGAP